MSIQTQFKNLQSKLRPLNLYKLNGETLVDAELMAYASGLNILNDELEVLEREAFVATSLTYGLINRERLKGPVKTHVSIPNRREMLISRTSVTSSDYTRVDIEKALISCGLDASIVELLDGKTIYFNCRGLLDEFLKKEEVIKASEEFLPAHLETIFDFRILTWDYIDENKMTFNDMDSKNMTWNDIDNYEEKV